MQNSSRIKYKSRLTINIAISVVILFVPLILSFQSINQSSEMIVHVEQEQLRLTELSSKLEREVEMNESEILQAILLKNDNTIQNLHNSFNILDKYVEDLELFASKSQKINGLDDVIAVIKRRIIGYKSVEKSIIEALSTQDKEDLEDAIIGFNFITKKFSDDIKKLSDLANRVLDDEILKLKTTNENSKVTILLSFGISLFLIALAFYKLLSLYGRVEEELIRSETAENELKKLQSQLLKYNDDLETEIRKKSEELHFKVYHNFLSGLPNRNKLLEDLHQSSFAQMAILNIDKFQQFNDVNGEEEGNIAIQLSAEFLLTHIDNENIVLYHIGGDEFVIVVKKARDEFNILFIETIKNILEEYRNNIFVGDKDSFQLSMSAGITFSGMSKMLAYADMAIKDAKKRNIALAVFNEDKDHEKEYQDSLECQKKLTYGLEHNGILSYFQPIVPIQDSSLPTKYESLVRLKEANGNVLPPFRFIEVAKRNRVYAKLTKVVFNNTLQTIEKYKIPCSVNLSMEDIENSNTLEMLFNRFEKFEYNNLITIELLETEEFKNYDAVLEFCKKI
ncbi:MAG: diguanylate cyclase, partial [Campylobacterota bacterium]|nr:diguanylate cyclase [Campylobacterota bacterium]